MLFINSERAKLYFCRRSLKKILMDIHFLYAKLIKLKLSPVTMLPLLLAVSENINFHICFSRLLPSCVVDIL